VTTNPNPNPCQLIKSNFLLTQHICNPNPNPNPYPNPNANPSPNPNC